MPEWYDRSKNSKTFKERREDDLIRKAGSKEKTEDNRKGYSFSFKNRLSLILYATNLLQDPESRYQPHILTLTANFFRTSLV